MDLDISWSTHTNKRGSEVDIPMLMAQLPTFCRDGARPARFPEKLERCTPSGGSVEADGRDF